MKIYERNINQQVRDYLSSTLDIQKTYGNHEIYAKKIYEVFDNLKKNDPKTYLSFLATVFSDYYKMLYTMQKQGKLSLEDEGSLIFFSSVKNINNLRLEITLMPDALVDMVDKSLVFNELSFFEKRKIFSQSKEKNAYIQRINPAHILDQIYYCKSYDPDLFISMYNDFMAKHKNDDKEVAKDLALESLSSLYEELKIYDPNNQQKLGYAMIRDYYIYKKYEEKNNKPSIDDKLIIKALEKDEMNSLCMLNHEIDSTDTTKNIIKGFIEYNTETSKEFREEAEESLRKNISNELKKKLHYDKRRKTVTS